MTADQIMGLVRQILPIFGGIAVALGWLTADQVSKWTGIILQAVGPLSILAGIIMSLIANSKSSIIQSASKMPEVTGLTTTDATLANAAKSADPQTDVVLK